RVRWVVEGVSALLARIAPIDRRREIGRARSVWRPWCQRIEVVSAECIGRPEGGRRSRIPRRTAAKTSLIACGIVRHLSEESAASEGAGALIAAGKAGRAAAQAAVAADQPAGAACLSDRDSVYLTGCVVDR